MRVMIIEDEPHAISILKKYIAKLPNLQVEQVCSDPLEGLKALNEQPIDLLFLDINLPNISGIELMKSLVNPPKVIFTTAYPDFALEGYELQVIDYLLKPFSFERFLKSINKVVQLMEIEKKALSHTTFESSHLVVKADRKLFQIPFEDIILLQAYGDYVKVITTDKQLLPKETLQNLYALLPNKSFIRIHRSHVIALSKIEYIEGNHVHIMGKNYPIGKPYKEELLRRMRE